MSLVMRVGAGRALLLAGVLSLARAHLFGASADPGRLDMSGPAVTWGPPAALLLLLPAALLPLTRRDLRDRTNGQRRSQRIAGTNARIADGRAVRGSVPEDRSVTGRSRGAGGTMMWSIAAVNMTITAAMAFVGRDPLRRRLRTVQPLGPRPGSIGHSRSADPRWRRC